MAFRIAKRCNNASALENESQMYFHAYLLLTPGTAQIINDFPFIYLQTIGEIILGRTLGWM